jgi:hypothetical protein
MSGTVVYQCGCSLTRDVKNGGVLLQALPCARHRGFPRVHEALGHLQRALADAHGELPPLQIEQEERGGQDWRCA